MFTKTKMGSTMILKNIEGDKRFFCQDGRIIQNLSELADCLNHMTEQVYHYHVTSDNNDFSNWIRDVLGDEKLASELNNISTSMEAGKSVMGRLARFQSQRNQTRRSKKRSKRRAS